jgi:hypothetical protein
LIIMGALCLVEGSLGARFLVIRLGATSDAVSGVSSGFLGFLLCRLRGVGRNFLFSLCENKRYDTLAKDPTNIGRILPYQWLESD